VEYSWVWERTARKKLLSKKFLCFNRCCIKEKRESKEQGKISENYVSDKGLVFLINKELPQIA
jgi:hypothetical protein